MLDWRSSALSRRNLLKTLAAASTLAVGGGLLTSCTDEATTDVTLKTAGGWPFGPMPDEPAQAANPMDKAYAESLQEWLDANPGVKIENVAFDIWNQEALVTAIGGGTAPSAFPGNVIGGWNNHRIRGAMVQGLSRDVTAHLSKHGLDDKLADYVKPLWDRWAVDGKFYCAPWLYNIGGGIHYRVDLIRELGLKEPIPEWTWSDVRTLAKGLTAGNRKGIALQNWGLGMSRQAENMDFHSRIPAPKTAWNWTWDYSAMADSWIPIIEDLRAMIFTDQSVLADVSFGDNQIRGAFVNEQAAMHNNSVNFFTAPPGSESAPIDLARKLNKPVEEVVGFTTQPLGRNGRTGTTQGQCDIVGFSPDLTDAEADKVVSLLMHVKGPGLVRQRKAVYEATKDPNQVYEWDNVMPLFKGILEQIPSSPEEAWGKTFMDTIRNAAKTPVVPLDAWFFPAEKNPGPADTVLSDMAQLWAYERDARDLRADLKRIDDTWNQQAASFTSSTPDDEFVATAQKFYAAQAEYWRTNAPRYYRDVYQGWYESVIKPALRQ